jgi:hypothetical protein
MAIVRFATSGVVNRTMDSAERGQCAILNAPPKPAPPARASPPGRDRDRRAGPPRPAAYRRSSRITTRGKPLMTDEVSAALWNPAFSNRARVPTYAMVRSTFRPRLSTG